MFISMDIALESECEIRLWSLLRPTEHPQKSFTAGGVTWKTEKGSLKRLPERE
jgi:hypothetical protein